MQQPQENFKNEFLKKIFKIFINYSKENLDSKKYHFEIRRECILRKLTKKLVKRLPTMSIVDNMPSLTQEARENIRKREENYGQITANRELVYQVINNSPNLYDEFLNALQEEDFEDLADELSKDGEGSLRSEENGFHEEAERQNQENNYINVCKDDQRSGITLLPAVIQDGNILNEKKIVNFSYCKLCLLISFLSVFWIIFTMVSILFIFKPYSTCESYGGGDNPGRRESEVLQKTQQLNIQSPFYGTKCKLYKTKFKPQLAKQKTYFITQDDQQNTCFITHDDHVYVINEHYEVSENCKIKRRYSKKAKQLWFSRVKCEDEYEMIVIETIAKNYLFRKGRIK